MVMKYLLISRMEFYPLKYLRVCQRNPKDIQWKLDEKYHLRKNLLSGPDPSKIRTSCQGRVRNSPRQMNFALRVTLRVQILLFDLISGTNCGRAVNRQPGFRLRGLSEQNCKVWRRITLKTSLLTKKATNNQLEAL